MYAGCPNERKRSAKKKKKKEYNSCIKLWSGIADKSSAIKWYFCAALWHNAWFVHSSDVSRLRAPPLDARQMLGQRNSGQRDNKFDSWMFVKQTFVPNSACLMSQIMS